MILLVTSSPGTATFTRGTLTKTVDAYWYPPLTNGVITYTYCPTGQTCTADPTPPPSVPEPATVGLVAIGLAGTLVRRRASR
jgi:hypothetical protein